MQPHLRLPADDYRQSTDPQLLAKLSAPANTSLLY